MVFDDNRGLQRALKLGKSMQPMILHTEESPISCGLQSKFQLVWYVFFVYDSTDIL